MLKPKARQAFTLIELLMVIAIIAILAALVLPVLNRASSTALKRTQCSNNVRQINFAVHMYADDHGDRIPYYTNNIYFIIRTVFCRI